MSFTFDTKRRVSVTTVDGVSVVIVYSTRIFTWLHPSLPASSAHSLPVTNHPEPQQAVQHMENQPLLTITTWPTHKASCQRTASGEAGSGVYAWHAYKRCDYAPLRAAPQHQCFRDYTQADCDSMDENIDVR